MNWISLGAVQAGGVFSDDGLRRAVLWRIWDVNLPLVNWLMLNPSDAKPDKDDPTVGKTIGFAERWNRPGLFNAPIVRSGGIVITNLYTVKDPDPSVLRTCTDPVGPGNDQFILDTAKNAAMVVCAWGADSFAIERAAQVVALLKRAGVPLHALRLNKGGAPAHPLYLPYSLTPKIWSHGS